MTNIMRGIGLGIIIGLFMPFSYMLGVGIILTMLFLEGIKYFTRDRIEIPYTELKGESNVKIEEER